MHDKKFKQACGIASDETDTEATWQEWRQTDIERLEGNVEVLTVDRDLWIDRYADSQNTMAIWRFAAVSAFIGIGVAFVRHIWPHS